MMTKQTKFILAITLQVAIIFAIIIFKLYVSFSGTKVMLRIAPVDPRHLLRGDYIALQYDISNLNCYAYKGRIKNGDTVYVVLRQSGKYWVAQNVQKTKPIEGELFTKEKLRVVVWKAKLTNFHISVLAIQAFILCMELSNILSPKEKVEILAFGIMNLLH